jgi:hypothetical protein
VQGPKILKIFQTLAQRLKKAPGEAPSDCEDQRVVPADFRVGWDWLTLSNCQRRRMEHRCELERL